MIVQLPQWPPCDAYQSAYPELSRWVISTSLGETFSTVDGTINLTVPKNLPMAITARPITKSGTAKESYESAFFKPAGLIYPYRKVYLTWEGGFLADIMLRLCQSKKETGITDEHIQDFLCSFNWKKAQESIDSKITKALSRDEGDNQKFYNPWLCDCPTLLTNLSFAEFKTSFLNNSGCLTLELAPDFEGTVLSAFVLENAFIAAKKTLLIQADCPTLFYTAKDYGIIMQGDSIKNLSLSRCKMPIFIEDKLYEDNS